MRLVDDLKDMLILGRFHFLFGGFLLFTLGALTAVSMGATADTMRFVLGYIVFFPAHLSVSYSNDLYDINADSFNKPSPFSGGSGVLGRRPELRGAAFVTAISLIAVSIGMSVVFTFLYDMGPIYPLYVIFGSLLGWFYTAPPLRLSYRGLGEVSTAVAVGILVPLTGYWSMMGRPDPGPLPLAPSMMLYGGAFILNVQVPDVEADLLGMKRSLATRLGRGRTLRLVSILFIMASVHWWGIYLLDLGPRGLDILPFALASLIPVLATLPSLAIKAKSRMASVRMVMANMGANFVLLGILDLALLI